MKRSVFHFLFVFLSVVMFLIGVYIIYLLFQISPPPLFSLKGLAHIFKMLVGMGMILFGGLLISLFIIGKRVNRKTSS